MKNMNYAINWRNSEQISECEWRTFTETLVVEETTTIAEIVAAVNKTRNIPLHVELNSITPTP